MDENEIYCNKIRAKNAEYRRKEAKMKKPTKKQLIKLAQILNEEIETLETRGLDDLDFFETAVWNTKSALINSYNMGYEKALKEIEKKEQQNAK